jgi:hypothetical protein
MVFPPYDNRRLCRPVQKHLTKQMLLIFAGKIIPLFVWNVNNYQNASDI